MHFAIGLILVCLLAGCGHVPLTSLPKLRGLDIMTLDASQLRVAVVMPRGLRVRRDSAVIVAGLKASTFGGAIEETFVLQEAPNSESSSGLPADAQIFRINPSDLPRLEAFRTTVRERKQSHPGDSNGFLTVTSQGCRTAPLPSGPLLVDTLLRTDDDAYFALTRNVDIRRLVPGEDLAEKLPPCE